MLQILRKAFILTLLLLIEHENNVRLCVSLPMWLVFRYTKSLYVCACCRYEISETNLGPLLDRIDIHIEVPRVDYEKLSGDRIGETSEAIRKRVQAARNIQLVRFSKLESSNIVANADMRVGEIRQFCKLQDEGQSLMRAAMRQMNLSARAYHRILKLARTIADLVGSEQIGPRHLSVQYRPRTAMD